MIFLLSCKLQMITKKNFFYSGIEDPNRVLIFTTQENIKHLVNSSILICDGTFKTSPSSFEPIFTIQCRLREMYLPVMFCFMKHKNEMSYDKIFKWIKSYQEDILNNEKSIIFDFELASFNSIKKRFIHSNLYGCCFHLRQIIWRKIQNLGFSSIVINNVSIKLQVKMILALSFVSFEYVVFYSLRLKSYIQEEKSKEVLQPFEWFNQEYIYNQSRNKSICFWNVKCRTEKKVPRTNNSLECYHRHLNTLVHTKQSSVILILNELKNEQTLTENKIFWSLYKEPVKKIDPFLNLLKNYELYEPVVYLKYIALNFNYKT
ncbi:hypothetical protein DMUE_2020 [Dictyocoela muelleri]|nr:hypothetical protein DMUE_2020 [Dictyocoela muelleri]